MPSLGEKTPEWAQAAFLRVSRFCEKISYYGASQFTNPGACPVSFEIEKEGEERKLYRLADVRAQATVVLIPRREIEAWLLYDSEAIARAFNERKKPQLPHDPELLPDPKGYLGRLVYQKYDKEYLNTKHNELIARQVNVSRLQRSRSFAPHPRFVAKILG